MKNSIIRCGKCRQIFMQDDEVGMEFDFYEQKISFICPKCKQESLMDMKDWKQKQKYSPLPQTQIV